MNGSKILKPIRPVDDRNNMREFTNFNNDTGKTVINLP